MVPCWQSNTMRPHCSISSYTRSRLALQGFTCVSIIDTHTYEPSPSRSSWFLRFLQVGPSRSPDNGHYPLSNGVRNPVHTWALPTLLRFSDGFDVGEIDLCLPPCMDLFLSLDLGWGTFFTGTTTAIFSKISLSDKDTLYVSINVSSSGWVRLLSTSSSYSTGTPIISDQKILNISPCTGLVFTSAHMYLVPLWRLSSYLWATLSVMRKNLFWMCLLFFPADILQFLANRMVDLLSWYKMLF